MKIEDILNHGSKKLKDKNVISHQLDSEILLSYILNLKRETILINSKQVVERKKILKFNEYIKRRSFNEPIAYIINKKEFWSKAFKVDKTTLIPRPETEIMIEKLINIFRGKKINILDIGTGSGCIIISLVSELKSSTGVGIDISKEALSVASENARFHQTLNRIKFIHKSVDDFYHKKFDLIVSNPPYIMRKDLKNLSDDIKKYEPKLALDGGNDGLDLIKKVIYKANEILKINGILALEIGNKQFKEVSRILYRKNFKIKHKVKDYRDNIRCIISKLNK
tara:strand:+ start:424 stop:1266 length:843 start_codon:yes stop_codon:yes gene_type:complete